jgi:hypothetical protein
MQPVWTLSVDLQTKTATFQTGMADAAKAARGSFQDIKSGADDMARSTAGSMMEARHGVMLLGEEFGVRLPRALTTFIASIGPIGAAMEAAFPFLAIIVGATLLLEHLAKLKQAGESLTESQTNFGTAAANVLNSWNDKILQAGIRTDELNGNHLGALNKTLELIDHQSMKELVSSFDTVAKAADATFAQLKTSWYQWGAGSAGAKNSLEQFKTAYDALLAKQDSKGGTALLDAKIEREQKILALQQEASRTTAGPKGAGEADMMKMTEARIALQKMGVDYSENATKAQVVQVGALQDLVKLEAARSELLKADQGNARKTEQNRGDDDTAKVAAINAATQRKVDEEAERDREKAYRTAVDGLQESERLQIDATKQGSAARLAAIDSAIKEEESKGLQEEGFYRSLKNSRVETARQMNDELKKLDAEAGKEAADSGEKMGMLQVAADKESEARRLTATNASNAARMDSAIKLENEGFAFQKAAAEKRIAALDQTEADYQNKLKALQDKEAELEKEHANKVAKIRTDAEIQTDKSILDAYTKFSGDMAKGLTGVITRQESMGKMLRQVGDQAASSLIENAIKAIAANKMTASSDAAKAARRAFLAGEEAIPGPAGVVLGGVLGAGAFASVLAFADGGIVPGTELFDSVNAKLMPGEMVIPKNITDRLMQASRNDGAGSGAQEIHIHHAHYYHVQAMDSEGMDRVLTKHASTVERHFNNHARKQNR